MSQTGGSLLSLMSGDDQEKLLRLLQEQPGRFAFDFSLLRKDRKTVHVWMRGARCGEYYTVSFQEDKVQDSVQQLLDRYHNAEEASQGILFEYNVDTDTIWFSRPLEEPGLPFTVPSFREVTLKSGMIAEEDLPAAREAFHGLRKTTARQDLFIRLAGGSGRYRWYQLSYSISSALEGQPMIVSGRLSNCTQEQRELFALREQTRRDPLTGLYNKTAIQALIGQCLEYEQDGCHALMIMDVDNFKYMNDTQGHLYGDAVLLEIAKILDDLFEGTGSVGRIGGDEFLIFLRCISGPRDAMRAAEQLCAALRKIEIAEEEGSRKFSGSVGVALFPRDGRIFSELFRSADAALYLSKQQGKDRWTFYEPVRRTLAPVPSFRKDASPASGKASDLSVIDWLAEVFLNAISLDEAIQKSLAFLGEHLHVSRAYIFENSADNTLSSNTFEWCAEGIRSEKEHLQNLPYSVIGRHDQRFDEQGIFACSDIHTLDPESRELLGEQGITSMFHCAFYEKGVFRGYVGFDQCGENRKWPRQEVKMLTLACRTIGMQLLRFRAVQRNAKIEQTACLLVEKRHRLTCVVEPDTYRLLYASDPVQLRFSGAIPGELCYQVFRGRHAPCAHCCCRIGADPGTEGEYQTFCLDNDAPYQCQPVTWFSGETAVLISGVSDSTGSPEGGEMDPLTRLPSLRRFKVGAEKLLSTSDSAFLLISVDFNKFKHINEAHGYARGDDIILAFSGLLKQAVGQESLLCRAADENFLALVRLDSNDDPDKFCSRLVDRTDGELHRRFPGVHIALSFGIYQIPKGNSNIIAAIDSANVARKTNKESHHTTVAFCTPEMTAIQVREKEVESRMHNALENGEFIPYFQPIYSLPEERMVGAEALVRWVDPRRGVLQPADFLPFFERNGFITSVDYMIFESVCRLMRQWQNQGKSVPCITANVSRLHLAEPGFADRYGAIARTYGISPKQIQLEITESAMMFDGFSTLQRGVERLHQTGFTVSVDDFGSGYSSLGLIMAVPYDAVKLDRTFFQAEMSVDKNRKFLGSIIQMVQQLGMKVVAEGVETEDHVSLLKKMNCDMAQGYYFARPMPAEEFEKLL